VEMRALLDDGAGAHGTPAAEYAVVTDDGAGLDDRSRADPTAVGHRAGPDDHTVVDDEVVVGEEMQHGVLEDLHVVADAHRSVRVADDPDAGADDRAFADDDVAGDLRRR